MALFNVKFYVAETEYDEDDVVIKEPCCTLCKNGQDNLFVEFAITLGKELTLCKLHVAEVAACVLRWK